MDLLDYHRGRLSARRLRVLLAHLPRDSALVRAMHGDAAQWGVAEHLLALVADHQAVGNWLFASAHTDRKRRAPSPPSPVPRPEGHPGRSTAATVPEATDRQLRDFFGT
ncbi:hypothetical protein [Nocardiopsis synnemataformans]|uniref:hypothetical protein n=1 Tax=Nocardiopsis synnemataformans TaxID=61305 RepID=UPI003EBB38A8